MPRTQSLQRENGGPQPTPSRGCGQLLSRPRSCHAWTSWPCPGSGLAPSQGPATLRWPPPGPASLVAAWSCIAPAASPAWPRPGLLPGRPPTLPWPPTSPSAGPARAAPDTPHPVSAGSAWVALGPGSWAVGLWLAVCQPNSRLQDPQRWPWRKPCSHRGHVSRHTPLPWGVPSRRPTTAPVCPETLTVSRMWWVGGSCWLLGVPVWLQTAG